MINEKLCFQNIFYFIENSKLMSDHLFRGRYRPGGAGGRGQLLRE